MNAGDGVKPEPFSGKVVLITGGSAGLGKALALAFARCKASLVLVARGAELLEAAAEEARALGADVLAAPADITSPEQVESLFARVAERFGRLDVLVNNAGVSGRKEILDTTPEDFRQALELNFLAAVRMTRAAAPRVLEAGGSVVNIASLAGKVGSRYMGAYPPSKFALVAYSQQLRLELGPRGLHVLLVCPGPIARDTPRDYGAQQQGNLPHSASKPGAGAKTRLIQPDWLAEKIIAACQRRKSELVIPGKARLLFALQQLSPRLGDWLLKKFS